MLSLDLLIKGFFGLVGMGVIIYFAGWIRSVRIREAQNAKESIEIDISKISDKFRTMPLDDLLSIENKRLRDRRAEHKTPKK